MCGNFSESKEKKLVLDDVDSRTFIKTLDIWCGRVDGQELELCEVQQLATVADRFQITEVTTLLEEAVMGQLSVEACVEVLMWSGGCGMLRLEAAALKMAAGRFEEFARTTGFMRLGEEALSLLLWDDRPVSADGGGVPNESTCGDGGRVGMACVVAEALRGKAARREGARVDRVGLGVRWEE